MESNYTQDIAQLEEQAENLKTAWIKVQGALEFAKGKQEAEKAAAIEKPVAKSKKK